MSQENHIANILDQVNAYAKMRAVEAKNVIDHVTLMSNIHPEKIKSAITQIQSNASVALHFHPDRLTTLGITISQSLIEDGFYRNQFETNISNGLLAPTVGSIRDEWECRLFGADNMRHVKLEDRPKYGALDLLRRPEGPSPRFGSCYFVLKPEISLRSTFTYLDSHRDPKEKGTLKHFDDIFAAMLSECFERQSVLGLHDIYPDELIDVLTDRLSKPYPNPKGNPLIGNLDQYIEAQVHGQINLAEDVLQLVCDASFLNTDTGKYLTGIGVKFKIPVYWHDAFSMKISQVPANFRGPDMPSLAHLVAEDGLIDARLIGEASRYQEWGDKDEFKTKAPTNQQLKFLWHLLVKYGC